jgi:hypothetical protein
VASTNPSLKGIHVTEYATLREKIAAEKIERQGRYAQYELIWRRAHGAGLDAGEACTPTPMVVSQHANPLNDSSPVSKAWFVGDGACGFAWVVVRPGNCAFAKWLVKNGHARKAYGGGVQVWVSQFSQSMARKEAYASAFAKVVTAAGLPGVTAYSNSRMD